MLIENQLLNAIIFIEFFSPTKGLLDNELKGLGLVYKFLFIIISPSYSFPQVGFSASNIFPSSM